MISFFLCGCVVQIVCVTDTGLDETSCYFQDSTGTVPRSTIQAPIHDLSRRKVVQYVKLANDGTDARDGHGTHTSGTAAGSIAGADLYGGVIVIFIKVTVDADHGVYCDQRAKMMASLRMLKSVSTIFTTVQQDLLALPLLWGSMGRRTTLVLEFIPIHGVVITLVQSTMPVQTLTTSSIVIRCLPSYFKTSLRLR